jgi:hypothetical protein
VSGPWRDQALLDALDAAGCVVVELNGRLATSCLLCTRAGRTDEPVLELTALGPCCSTPDCPAADPEVTERILRVRGWLAERGARGEPPVDEAPGGAVEADGPVLTFLSADEALTLAPEAPVWLWDDYVGEGLVTVIAGPPKRAGGKSTFVWALVEALLTSAQTFVGRYVRPGPVVYLTEEPLALLRPKLVGLAGAAGLSLVCRDNAPRPKPSWASSIRQAAARCREAGARLLVIDTLAEWARFKADAEKDAGAMAEAAAALADAAAEGIAIVLVHHHRKGGGEDGEALRGSSALPGAVNVIVDLTRLPGKDSPPRQRILNASSHWPGTPESMIVELAEDTSGYRLIGVGERETVRTVAHEAEAARLDDRIVAAVEAGAVTQQEVADALDVTRQRVQPRFRALVKAGRLTEEKGAGRRPARYAPSLLQPPRDEGLQQTRAKGEADAPVVVAAAPIEGAATTTTTQRPCDEDHWQQLYESPARWSREPRPARACTAWRWPENTAGGAMYPARTRRERRIGT